MASEVRPELNTQRLLFVGRDPGGTEMALGRPFVGPAGTTLMDAIGAAGHRRQDASYANVVPWQPPNNEFGRHIGVNVDSGIRKLHALIEQMQPNLVVALGNEASWTTVADWPSRSNGIFSASGIEARRGYLWAGRHGGKVLTTLHPSAVMRDHSGISAMLFHNDIAKAFAEAEHATLRRPKRDVIVVSSAAQLRNAAAVICSAPVVACDIEITAGPGSLVACVGFAVTPQVAYVFPVEYLSTAFELLQRESLRTVWQNGQFDLHMLLTRHGVRVAGPIEDTIVQWHTLWPEMAGAAQDRVEGNSNRHKRTHKGLAFLASMHTTDAWWKDYDFETVQEKYILNGRDCCITYDVWQQLNTQIDAKRLREVYEMTLRRVWPCVEMQAHGLLVDEGVRRANAEELKAQREVAVQELQELALEPLTLARERLAKPHLIWQRKVCPCCRNGKGKRETCWTCAGFDAAPSKKALEELASQRGFAITGKKEDFVRALLAPCVRCAGAGEWEDYEFNPGSNEQLAMLLFEALRLPKRASVDEAALKGLLGVVSNDGL